MAKAKPKAQITIKHVSDPASDPSSSSFSAATVTETAILRSQMEDLQALVAQQGDVLAEHHEEIRKLRRQVRALRDGAKLAEEP